MSSATFVDKKFFPKLTKSYIGVGLISSHDTDEIGTDITNLEREMRSLHNRLAQIECNTDQKLADLGERLHTLNKAIDNLNTNCETPKSVNPTLDNSVNCRSYLTSTPNYSTSTSNKPKWASPLIFDRPRAGEDSDYYRPKFKFSNISTGFPDYGREIGKASRLRAELNLREKNLAMQERELTSRRNQLLARIKSLTSQSWSENTLPKLENAAKSRSSCGETRSQSQWKDDSRSPQTQSQTVF